MIIGNAISPVSSFVPGGGASGLAASFIADAVITDSTQKAALTQLEIDIDSIKDKIIALYPFVGGTALQHEYNFMDTSAFKITWFGGVTHNANGYQANGTNGYGATGIIPSTDQVADDMHISFYSKTDNTGGVTIGSRKDGGFREGYYFIGNGGSNTVNIAMNDGSGGNLSGSNSTTNAMFVLSRTSTTLLELMKDGVLIDSDTVLETIAAGDFEPYLSALNDYDTNISNYDNKIIAGATFGAGLSQAEAIILDNAFTAFNTTLSRDN